MNYCSSKNIHRILHFQNWARALRALNQKRAKIFAPPRAFIKIWARVRLMTCARQGAPSHP